MGEIDIYSGVYIINTTYESLHFEVHWNRFVFCSCIYLWNY